MKNNSYFKMAVRICVFLQILIGYSIFNYSAAATSSCGAPTYNRATQGGIYLWQICSTGDWYMRVVGGGLTSANGLRVEGSMTLNSPIQTISGFSLEPANPAEAMPEPDFVSISDPKNIRFRFRVWSDAQDGMNFKIPANSKACLKFSEPTRLMPIFLGKLKTQMKAPFNLVTLNGHGCPGITTPAQLLLLD